MIVWILKFIREKKLKKKTFLIKGFSRLIISVLKLLINCWEIKAVLLSGLLEARRRDAVAAHRSCWCVLSVFFRLIMSRLNRGRGGAPGGRWGATLQRLPRLEGGARPNSPGDVPIAIGLPRPWQRPQSPGASVSRASGRSFTPVWRHQTQTGLTGTVSTQRPDDRRASSEQRCVVFYSDVSLTGFEENSPHTAPPAGLEWD